MESKEKFMITITNRIQRAPDEHIWDESKNNTYECQLQQYFSNTQLRTLFLSRRSIQGISAWITPLEEELDQLNGYTIPEKGGLLMGTYRLHGQAFETFVHSFAPIKEVELQTNVFWKVGKGITEALIDVVDQFPSLLVVGWLHTHPGHGPFLSDTDLNQTQIFFPHPYQVAIVIDPLTEKNETGLFTRKDSGKMNNANDQLQWLHWGNLEALHN